MENKFARWHASRVAAESAALLLDSDKSAEQQMERLAQHSAFFTDSQQFSKGFQFDCVRKSLCGHVERRTVQMPPCMSSHGEAGRGGAGARRRWKDL